MGAAQWAKTAWIETQGNVCPFSLNLTLRLCYQAHTMEEKNILGKCQQVLKKQVNKPKIALRNKSPFSFFSVGTNQGVVWIGLDF